MRVRANKWSGHHKDEFLELVKNLVAPFVDKNIILTNPQGKIRHPKKDGNFRIHCWSRPEGEEGDYEILCEAPYDLWSIVVVDDSDAFLPVNKGEQIIDPENDWVVAELIDDELYIYLDICSTHHRNNVKIFRRICEEIPSLLGIDPEVQKELFLKDLRRRKRGREERWINECSRRFEKELASLKDDINEIQRSVIPALQHKLVENIRSLRLKRALLESKLADEEKIRERYSKELKKILEIPNVLDVTVDKNLISVYTETLFVEADGVTYELGQYRIEIHTDTHEIRFFNLTRQVDGFWSASQHPHVNGEGEACFGNIERTMSDLITDYFYSPIIIVALQFLQTVNTEDNAGAQVINWPVVQLEKPTGSKATEIIDESKEPE